MAARVYAADASALSGEWHVKPPSDPNYVGVVLIDAERRVTWDAPVDFARPARYQGYIVTIDGTKIASRSPSAPKSFT